MTGEQNKQSWWQTIPGILTTLAGVITAIATLVATLNQAGWFDSEIALNKPSNSAVSTAEAAVTPMHPTKKNN